MAKYVVTITETLSRRVLVEAGDADQAGDIVSAMYYDCDIILDADDYIDTEFEEIKPADEWDIKHLYLVNEEDEEE